VWLEQDDRNFARRELLVPVEARELVEESRPQAVVLFRGRFTAANMNPFARHVDLGVWVDLQVHPPGRGTVEARIRGDDSKVVSVTQVAKGSRSRAPRLAAGGREREDALTRREE
jgi:hypothetical protein